MKIHVKHNKSHTNLAESLVVTQEAISKWLKTLWNYSKAKKLGATQIEAETTLFHMWITAPTTKKKGFYASYY